MEKDNEIYAVLCNINEWGMIGSYESCLTYYNYAKRFSGIIHLCKIIKSNYNDNPESAKSISTDYSDLDFGYVQL